MMLPRFSKGTPTASNSRLYQPDAMPTMRRPFDIWSMLESCFASTSGFLSGKTSTPVPSLILLVRAATAVRSVNDSMMGKCGSTPSRIWSHTQRDSKTQLLHGDAIFDERRRVGEFGIRGEIPHGDSVVDVFS